jgi:SAM-dependent methyltransferase
MPCTLPVPPWKKVWRAGGRARQAVVANGVLEGDNADQDAGITLVLRAIEEPLRQIVANAGDEPSVVATVGLADGSIDVIVSNLGVNNLADPAAVMLLCARVARPGASFVLTTNVVGHMAEFYEVYRQVLLATGQGDRVAKFEAHIDHHATVDSVRQLLEGGGFEITEMVSDSFRLRFADGSSSLRHHFIRLGFLQSWVDIATPGKVLSTFEALKQALDRVAAERSELALTIPTLGVVACKR